ncbi:MAG: GxxExxY protein [Chitinophagaceae bacterium]
MKHEEVTEQIIKAFYTVYNTLGYGFLEKVYENAMYIELTGMGYKVDRQKKGAGLLQRANSRRLFI